MGKGCCQMTMGKSPDTPSPPSTELGSNVILIQPNPVQPDNDERRNRIQRKRKLKILFIRLSFAILGVVLGFVGLALGVLFLVSHYSSLLEGNGLPITNETDSGIHMTKIQLKISLTVKVGSIHRSSDGCAHWRTEDGGMNVIIHDTKSGWSALVNHYNKGCLMFAHMGQEVDKCPDSYPWAKDSKIGVLPCRVGKSTGSEVVTRVMRLVNGTPMANITETGPFISHMCRDYKSNQVLAVLISYQRHSISARSADKGAQLGEEVRSSGQFSQEVVSFAENEASPEDPGINIEFVEFEPRADDIDVEKFKKSAILATTDTVVE